jgi:hypothetical protein
MFSKDYALRFLVDGLEGWTVHLRCDRCSLRAAVAPHGLIRRGRWLTCWHTVPTVPNEGRRPADRWAPSKRYPGLPNTRLERTEFSPNVFGGSGRMGQFS